MDIKTKYLNELVSIKGGGTPSRSIDTFWGGNIAWATVKDITSKTLSITQETITEDGLKNSASNLINPGSIIVPTRMGLGKAAINKIPVAINQDLKALSIIDNNEVNLNYIFQFILSKSKFIEKQGEGATVKGIKIDVLNKLLVPLPPLEDQIRIANLLSRIEELIAKRKESIRLLDEFVKSTFLEMFGDNSKAQIIKFDDLKADGKGTFSNGPFGSNLLTSELTDSGIPVVYIRDIRDGSFIWKSNVFVTEEKAKQLQDCVVLPGDLLIAKVGDPPGIAAILSNIYKKAIITQDVIRVRVNEEIANQEYLKYYLNSHLGQKLIEKITIKGTRKRFSLGELKKLGIPIYPLALQNKFADIINKVQSVKIKFQDSLSKLEKLYGSESQRAFRGKM